MDPQLTSDGRLYAPIRYKQIVKERYYISKNIHTSYNDIGKLTPLERQYLIEFINEEGIKEKELIEKHLTNYKRSR